MTTKKNSKTAADGNVDGARPQSENGNDAGKEEVNNEYVLNVAFFSFFIFMMVQAAFAIIARSQSMLADSMAMSVDAFTYLFNLAAERLKHRSSKRDDDANIPIEEKKRRKKIMRLYLEFIPPTISITALVAVSIQAFMEAMSTIVNYGSDTNDEDAPDAQLMLIFSGINLGLDILNVSCFSKLQNFSLIGDMAPIENDSKQYREEDSDGISNEDEDVLGSLHEMEMGNKEGPNKMQFPPSIIVDTSMDSSFDSAVVHESDGLLGIPVPNYGAQKSDNEWGEEFSLDAVRGDVSDDGLTSEGISIGSMETGDSYTGLSHTHSKRTRGKSMSSMLPLDEGPDELGDISEGDEKSESSDSEDNDSEKSGQGFNLNMCSAYTHVMADTLRSIAVLVAASLSYVFNSISSDLADASAAIVVSIIIAASLGPLIVGLLRTWGELKELKREVKAPVVWYEEYQHLPSMSPRITSPPSGRR